MRFASRTSARRPSPRSWRCSRRRSRSRPAPMLAGFNTSGFDIPCCRYRAIALGVPMPSLNGGNGRDYGYRYGKDHFDLADRLSGFRASPMPSLAEARRADRPDRQGRHGRDGGWSPRCAKGAVRRSRPIARRMSPQPGGAAAHLAGHRRVVAGCRARKLPRLRSFSRGTTRRTASCGPCGMRGPLAAG